MALEESSYDNDIVEEIESIKFLINENQKYYFDNAKLDFKKNIFGSGEFTIVDI